MGGDNIIEPKSKNRSTIKNEIEENKKTFK